MKSLPIIFVVVLLISGCSSHKLEATMDKSEMSIGHYELSDNYANHRLQQKRIATKGGELAVLDVGANQAEPSVVLIHGVPTSSWLFRKMIDDLQNDFRVIGVDLLGYGNSDKPKSIENNYSPSSQADYVEHVLRQLDVDSYHLVFHDMGGLVAWELLARDIRSKRSIHSFSVLNTIVSQHGFNHPKMEKGVMAKLMSEAFANSLSSAAVLEQTFRNMGLSSNRKLSEAECFGYVAPMREGADNALYDFYTGFDDAMFAQLSVNIEHLKSFDGRVQVLWGAQDKVLTTQQLPRLEKALGRAPDASHIYQDNSHFLPEEIPLKLSAKIRGFLLAD